MIQFEKNFEKYSHNGYCYVKGRESADGDRIFWRCDERTYGCNGRVWTTSCENRNFIRLVTRHSCSKTGNAVSCCSTSINTVRQRAATTMENPAQIMSTVVQGVSTAVLGLRGISHNFQVA